VSQLPLSSTLPKFENSERAVAVVPAAAVVAVVGVLPEQCHIGSVGFTSSKQIRHAAIPFASPVTCSESRSKASEKREVSASSSPPPRSATLFLKPSAAATEEDDDIGESKVSKVVKYRSKIARV
jgi:hypothetical protein